MAEKAREYHIPLIHFSTDYVFDGEKKEAYLETDLTNPIGIYGESKLAGEEEIQEVGGQNYIFRTSWVYSTIGHNFFLTMKKLCQEREELKVVSDQMGVPTSNQFIAKQIKKSFRSLIKTIQVSITLYQRGLVLGMNLPRQLLVNPIQILI